MDQILYFLNGRDELARGTVPLRSNESSFDTYHVVVR